MPSKVEHFIRSSPRGNVVIEGLEKRTLFAVNFSSLIVTRPQAFGIDDSSKTAALSEGTIAAALVAPGFQIEVRFPDNSLTASQKAVFVDAANRWQQILTGDLSDVNLGGGDVIDDMRIDATAPAIDGVGSILGQAGPTGFRNSNKLPYTGTMQFDSADVAQLESNGQFNDVILHEMGHVLGFGTIWGRSRKNLLTGAGGTDPEYIGAIAAGQYQSIFGVNATTVPVENTGGSGTRDSHWREATFDNELMTGFLNGSTSNLLSRITIGQFADLGYPGVNINAYDPYVAPGGGNPAPSLSSLTASPNPTPPESLFTLTANSVVDPNGSVQNVKFYKESNGIPGLQIMITMGATAGDPVGDTLLGTDTAGPYTQDVSTAGAALGTYTYYAQATDNQGNVSLTASTTHTVANAAPATISSRHLFYNDSVSDGFDAGANAADDGAIAPDKSPLLPGGSVTSAHVSGYGKGINGVMIDISGLPAGTVLSASDFSFRSSTAGSWVAGPVPSSITVRTGISSGVDRVTLIWPESGTNQAVQNGWLEVTVSANANTGLTAADVFAFGNLVGDANGDSAVSVGDLGILSTSFNKAGSATISEGDFNGDGAVTVGDLGVLSTHFGQTLAPPPTLGLLTAGVSKTTTTASTSLLKATKTQSYVVKPIMRKTSLFASRRIRWMK